MLGARTAQITKILHYVLLHYVRSEILTFECCKKPSKVGTFEGLFESSTFVYALIHTYIHTYTYIIIHTCTHVQTSIPAYMNASMHIYVCACVRTYVPTYLRMYIQKTKVKL